MLEVVSSEGKEEILQSHNFVYRFLNRHHENHLIGKLTIVAVFGLLALLVTSYTNVPQTQAAATSPICAGNEQAHSTASGALAAHPGVTSTGQHHCVSNSKVSPATVLGPEAANSSSISDMINSVFGSYAGSAMRIATCESSLNPNATNSIAIGGSHAEGVFQILYPSTWSTTSQAGASPYDAYANIVAAHEIFARDGNSWREWECQA